MVSVLAPRLFSPGDFMKNSGIKRAVSLTLGSLSDSSSSVYVMRNAWMYHCDCLTKLITFSMNIGLNQLFHKHLLEEL